MCMAVLSQRLSFSNRAETLFTNRQNETIVWCLDSINRPYNMLKLKTYVWTPSSVLHIHSPSVLRIHSPSVRGQCLSSVRGQFQKWTNWLKALSELSIAFLPPGVRVNGVSCLDNCPEVRSVAFNVPAKRDILTDRQTIRGASEHLALLKTMQSSHPEITVSLK